MSLRKLILWLHLPVGVTAGLVILVMSLTGVLLAYERQITAWADRNYRAVPPTPATRLPLETLITKLRAAEPNSRPSSVIGRADPSAPVAVALGRERTLFVDPYSGAVLGEGSRTARGFFQSVNGWHRWLALQADARALGRGLTGAANLGFLFLVVSGAYLWWPRTWSAPALRPVTLFQRRLAGRARDFNWHNVFGFWSALPLLFIVASGVVMSYPWANNLLYRLASSEPPPPRGPESAGAERGMRERRGDGRRDGAGRLREPEGSAGSRRERDGAEPALELDGLDRVWAIASARVPEWRSISLRLPPSGGPWTFSIDTGDGGRPDQRAQLVLDRSSGDVVRWEPFESYNLGRRLRSWARFVHTGEAGGLLGQTLAALASAAGAMLVWTGLALAWRRFLAWRRRSPKRSVASAPSGFDIAPAQMSAATGLLTKRTDESA
jgi:uncharacterized iron-regulated membrane protein